MLGPPAMPITFSPFNFANCIVNIPVELAADDITNTWPFYNEHSCYIAAIAVSPVGPATLKNRYN